MRGGGTDFGRALIHALEVASRGHNNNFELYHFIMMSDGEASYPHQEVLEFKNSSIFRQKKVKFTAIGHGEDSEFDSLICVAKELGGTMEKTAAPSDLEETFIRLAPNAYGIAQKK